MADETQQAASAIHPGFWTLIGMAVTAAIHAMRDTFNRSKLNEERIAKDALTERVGEREITAQIAREDREDRRRLEAEIRGLQDELRDASARIARYESERERHAEDRESLLELVATLRTQVDMSTQLIERQKKQIDDLVRRLMTGPEGSP